MAEVSGEEARLRGLVQTSNLNELNDADLSAALGVVEVHQSVAGVLRWFTFDHLPEPLRSWSRHFAELALALATDVRPDPELTVALRKLLEAKDAAVRAVKAEMDLTA